MPPGGHQSHLSAPDLAAELRDARGRSTRCGRTSDRLRTVFSWSYRQLPAAASQLFRLLGSCPARSVSTFAASALLDLPQRQTRALLDQLIRMHLLNEYAPGRYQMHDLLRAYAAEQMAGDGGEAERRAAVERVLDYYLSTAHAAALHVYPHRPKLPPSPSATRFDGETITDYRQAMEWYKAEQSNLLLTITYAGTHGWDEYTWRMSWILTNFFRIQGQWQDQKVNNRLALDAARRLGDVDAEALCLNNLAIASTRLGEYDEGIQLSQQAFELLRHGDNLDGRADALDIIGWTHGLAGRYREAIDYRLQAVEYYRSGGNLVGQAVALNGLGWSHIKLGQFAEALGYSQQALELHRATHNHDGRARTLDTLGYAHTGLGQFSEAIVHYEQALELHVRTGNRYYEADTYQHLGATRDAMGDRKEARRNWRKALRSSRHCAPGRRTGAGTARRRVTRDFGLRFAAEVRRRRWSRPGPSGEPPRPRVRPQSPGLAGGPKMMPP